MFWMFWWDVVAALDFLYLVLQIFLCEKLRQSSTCTKFRMKSAINHALLDHCSLMSIQCLSAHLSSHLHHAHLVRASNYDIHWHPMTVTYHQQEPWPGNTIDLWLHCFWIPFGLVYLVFLIFDAFLKNVSIYVFCAGELYSFIVFPIFNLFAISFLSFWAMLSNRINPARLGVLVCFLHSESHHHFEAVMTWPSGPSHHSGDVITTLSRIKIDDGWTLWRSNSTAQYLNQKFILMSKQGGIRIFRIRISVHTQRAQPCPSFPLRGIPIAIILREVSEQ